MSPGITMAEAITALVAEKRAVGYKYDAEERVLARFAAFCRQPVPRAGGARQGFGRGVDHLGPGAGSQAGDLARAGRAGAGAGPLAGPPRLPAYVLPAGALPRPARYVPHIYTDEELAALFAQADRCHYDSQVPFRHLVMPVLFRTIYACGLRASEARLLRFDDVDLDTGVLQSATARAAKTGRCPSASRCATGSLTTTPRSPGAPAGTGSSPARPGGR